MTAKIGKITGPPGCGKTTEVMRLIKAACNQFDPSAVGVVSFTNASVEEVKSRIFKGNSKAEKRTADNIRTMHSHCYKLLELSKSNVAESHIKDFNEEYPHFKLNHRKIKNDSSSTWEAYRDRTNTALFNSMQILRNKMVPISEWNPQVQEIHTCWAEWMERNNFTDFTGMLEKALVAQVGPAISILFVDEAQDLTPLQHKVIELWSERTYNTTFAGDSDQCIFRFSGAVPENFINLSHGWLKHLGKSYRNSPAVYEYARKVAEGIGDREDTDYEPTREYGEGQVLTAITPDLSLEGTHMIICRCDFQIKRWIEFLLKEHEVWSNPYRIEDRSWNPQLTKSWQAIITYQKLMRGLMVRTSALRSMVDCMIAKDTLTRGAKTEILGWKITKETDQKDIDLFDLDSFGFTQDFIDQKLPIKAMFKTSGRSTDLLEYMLDQDVDVETKPRVIVGTIHSIKGGEADHVWIDTGITNLIYQEIRTKDRARYDEARVAYVAATRARKTVGLLRSRLWNPMLPKT